MVTNRLEVFEKDNYICQLCLKKRDEKDLHAHHAIPVRFGELNSINNLFTACKNKCHGTMEIGRHKDLTRRLVSVRISESNYNKAVKGFEYGTTFNSIFEKILLERDEAVTMLQQNTGGKNKK